jgi:hypothetical protein
VNKGRERRRRRKKENITQKCFRKEEREKWKEKS